MSGRQPRLPDVPFGKVRELYASFAEAHADQASSNDVVQLLDDWFVAQGFPTVIYAPAPREQHGRRSRRW